MDEVPIQSTSESTDMSSLQEVIENEFNMQILMKHNELRLIEQEQITGRAKGSGAPLSGGDEFTAPDFAALSASG